MPITNPCLVFLLHLWGQPLRLSHGRMERLHGVFLGNAVLAELAHTVVSRNKTLHEWVRL